MILLQGSSIFQSLEDWLQLISPPPGNWHMEFTPPFFRVFGFHSWSFQKHVVGHSRSFQKTIHFHQCFLHFEMILGSPPTHLSPDVRAFSVSTLSVRGRARNETLDGARNVERDQIRRKGAAVGVGGGVGGGGVGQGKSIYVVWFLVCLEPCMSRLPARLYEVKEELPGSSKKITRNKWGWNPSWQLEILYTTDPACPGATTRSCLSNPSGTLWIRFGGGIKRPPET